jgi:hypothetical protein
MYSVVLVDTENFIKSAVYEGRIVSWPKLRDFLLKEVLKDDEKLLFALLYLPEALAMSHALKDAEESGFALRLCRRTKNGKDSDHDTVDDRLKRDVLKFLMLEEVGHIVIVSDDAHMAAAASDATLHRRKVTVVSSSVASQTLKRVVGQVLTMPL